MYREKIIVTGASRGIGKAITLSLLKAGYFVQGISRSSTISDEHYQHSSIDLSDIKKLPEQLKTLRSHITTLKAMICNAGIGLFGHLEELSFGDIESLISLNLISQIYLIKTFLPLFKTQGAGDIIIIGSESALHGAKQGTIYCASKFGLRGFAQALRDECRKSDVRVTLIHPGFVKSDFFESLHFHPGESTSEHILPEDFSEIILSLLETRKGIVFDEIILSPQKKKILNKS